MNARRRLAPLFLLLASIAALPAMAKEVERDYNQRFDVSPGARLHLVHGDGDVAIIPWDEPAIEVEVRYRATARRIGVGSDLDFGVDFRQRGNTVRVEGKERGMSGVGIFHVDRHEYLYRVRAPHWVSLELRGDDGDVVIDGWRAAIDVELDDGNLRLRDVALPRDAAGEIALRVEDGGVEIDGLDGELRFEGDDGELTILDCKLRRSRIEISDGDVMIDRCEGDLTVVCDDGEVRLANLGSGRLEVETEDGDVIAELLAGAPDVAIETDDGDVDLELAAGVSARFEVRMDDGRVELELPGARGVERREHRLSGTLGDGAGTIAVTTADGRVRLRSR
ncbi:MAG: hypothetical protein D6696_10880 [Acidobacteria bacterium]|nr:MAG: hypothetical protein D6696_10880 [Acidobacteriota bacterium]